MSKSPLWFRRLLVSGVSTLTVGGLGVTGLLGTAGAASATAAFKVNQLAGTDRFATAAAIAAAAFPNGANTIIVASGLDTNLPDSLAASYLAAQQNGGTGAPILLVNADSVPGATAQAILSLKAKKIIIVGGTTAVNASVAATLTNGGAITVTRVAGNDRFLTADAIDSQTGFEAVGPKKTAIVADGVNQSLVDALGASPLAGAGPYPMFLVNGAAGLLSTTDLSIMKADGITNAIIVGGSAAVGPQVGTQLTAAGITPTTEAGTDRSATSDALANYEIANDGFSNTRFDIAGGGQANLVDALAGGPLGAGEKAPTLITDSPNNAASVVTFASANAATEASANLFGGSDAVSAATEAAIVAAAQSVPAGTVSLPQLLSAKVLSTDPVLGSTVQYTFSKPVLTATATDFKVYPADGMTPMSGTSASVQAGGTTVNVVFSPLKSTTSGTDDTDIANYTLATVKSGAVTTGTGSVNPDGSAAIGSSSSTTLTPGKTNAPNLLSVGNFRASGSDTLVDFTFDTAPTSAGAMADYVLVSTTGVDTPSTGTPVLSGDTVTATFAPTVNPALIARGYVKGGFLTDAAFPSATTPLEAAPVSAGGATVNADLASATLEPNSQVLYTFDQPLTGKVMGSDFGVFELNGTEIPGTGTPAVSGNNVLVTFTPTDSFANVVGANVKSDSTTDSPAGTSNYNADEVGVTNTSATGQTAGVVDAPQLSSVTLSMGVLSEQATYTFTQPITTGSVTASDFHLYDANGTELTGTACAAGTGSSVRTVVCSLFMTSSAIPVAPPTGSEVLGTVDYGAVTGSTAPDNNKNPEGAAAA